LTGPRRLFCSNADQEGADRVVFDTLTFRGVKAGEALAKRNWDDSEHPEPHQIHMIYSDEHDGLLHGRHAPELVHKFNQMRRKRGESEMAIDPVAAGPGRDNFAMNTAAGTLDIKGADGAPAGDHPMRVFPETYSAPLTLDPVQSASEEEPLVYDGELVTGVPPKFCDLGELGCGCRPTTALSQCDAPYECNSLNYCVLPECPAGGPGCQAHNDNTCDGDLIVGADGKCVYKPNCKLGSLGCAVMADGTCSEGEALDGFCTFPPAAGDVGTACSISEPGCTCDNDGKCNDGASCDGFSGLCLFESCVVGTPGCRAQRQGAPCTAGFVANGEGNCVASDCAPGDAGCECLQPSRSCNTKGFTCLELTRDGSKTACVGQDLCPGGQEARCALECGPGNVAVCGQCVYSQPICIDPSVQYCNKESYLYGIEPCDIPTPASSMLLSVVAALVAMLALF
jgi:hypothetical protein